MLETKVLDMNIKGKDGFVQTKTIQRHNPDCDMFFIILSTGYTIFCQENHPLIIENDMIVEAKDVTVDNKIWCDNSISFNDRNIIPSESPSVVAGLLIDILQDKTNNCHSDVIIYDEIHSLRLNSNFINYDRMWLYNFVDTLKLNYITAVSIESYVLVQQLRMICDKVGVFMTSFVGLDTPEEGVRFSVEFHNIDFSVKMIGYYHISDIVTVKNWKHFVYDIKTESSEFMLGGVQTHNSFHTGGVIVLLKTDIIKEIMSNIDSLLESKIRKYIRQEENTLVVNDDLILLRIDKHLYEESSKKLVKLEGDNYNLPIGYLELVVGGMTIPVNIENPTIVHLPSTEEYEEDSQYISISYSENEKMFTVEPIREDYGKLAGEYSAIISGKSPYTDAESFYRKLWFKLSGASDFDSVHLEIVISNVMRWRQDLQVPARLKVPYDPVLVSEKQLPGTISWPLGLAFENFGQAISQGLVSDRGPESPVEKIFFGESISGLKEKK